MKKTFTLKPLALSLAVASAATVATVPTVAQAGVSANAGLFTDYIFRGVNQHNDKGSYTVQGGLDYESDMGIYAGVWASSVELGFEYDLYVGYGTSVGDVDLGIAYTNYSYTDQDYVGAGVDKQGTFQEINLSAGYGMFSLGVDLGEDAIAEEAGDEEKYLHYSVSADMSEYVDGVSLTYGSTKYDGADTEADYLDVGYAATLDMGVDFGLNFILSGKDNDDTGYIVAGFSKTFDLM